MINKLKAASCIGLAQMEIAVTVVNSGGKEPPDLRLTFAFIRAAPRN